MTPRRLLLGIVAVCVLAAGPASALVPLDVAGLDDDPHSWACTGVDLIAATCIDNPFPWLDGLVDPVLNPILDTLLPEPR